MKHKILVATFTVLILMSTSVVLVNRALSAPGDLDTTFNGTGSAHVGFGQGNDAGNAIAAQSDGKLVVVGVSRAFDDAVEIIRYNTDGSLDTTFGGLGRGKIRAQVFGSAGSATAVKIQPDNKIVVAGTVAAPGSGDTDFGVMRLNSDGSFDQTFGTGGIVKTPVHTAADDVAAGLAIQLDGKLVVVGSSLVTNMGFAVVRYNADGSLDTSFNGTGKVVTAVGPTRDFASSVVVQPDGKIVVAGSTTPAGLTSRNFLVIRYNTNGTRDSSWGGSGWVITDFGGATSDDLAYSIAIQPGTPTIPDTIVVAGFNDDFTAMTRRFAVVRYTLAGVLDSSFGTGGKVTTPITSEVDVARSIGVQSPNTFLRKIVVSGQSFIGGSSAFSAVRYNADGSLDSSFDSDGKLTTSFGLNAGAKGMVMLPNSRFALAGTSNFDANAEGDFAVARYNSDGSIDSSFDGDGRRTDDSDVYAAASGLVVQPDQRIVVVGDCYEDDNKVFALVRYNENGTLDTSFDGDGRVITKFGGDDSANDVALQIDGKIVVVGSSYDGQHARFALARYTSNGSLDNSFGVGGKVITPSSTTESASGVAFQSDGKIVVAGTVETTGFNSIFGLARYNTNGTLDSSFGSGGKVTTAIGSNAVANDLVIQPDGRIVLAGYAHIGGNTQFVVIRYNSNGSLDSSFGLSGIATTLVGTIASYGYSIAVQTDGRLVVGGQTDGGGLALVRYNSNGSLDSTFDGDGKLVLDAPSSLANVRGIAIQSDGKIVAGGFSSNPITFADFGVMRFNSNGATDTTYGNNGRVLVDLSNRDSDGAVGIALDPSGRAVLAGFGDKYFITMRVLGGSVATPTPTPTPTPTATPTPTPTPPANVVQFSASNYNVQEDCTSVTITVNRIGDTSTSGSVDYSTSDVLATEKRDYIKTLGTVSFPAGETTKSFAVMINEDSFVEGTEQFNINLINPVGVSLGFPTVSSVFIADDAIELPGNPIDDPQNFVCQHYHDFLNRDPDPSGLAFWTGTITSCNGDPQCIAVKRINASAAFYLSIEFQQTGYFVERIYKTSFGNASGTSTLNGTHQLPVPIVQLSEFLSDTQLIGLGVIVGQGNWEQLLDNNKSSFANRFVQRSRFTSAFPITMSAAEFVDALNVNAGNPLSQSERNQLVTELGSGAKTRAQVLQAVAQDADVVNGESNRAFVLMQYFGYLRRNPNDPQDSDHTGYDFWLTKLNQFGGNFQDAEMVKAFILSSEYRNRFGP